MTQRIRARYLLETGADPERAAQTIAGEQSSGTFLKLANETAELKERAGARVERLDVLEQVNTPSLPGAKAASTYTRCELELSWPIENLGPCLPSLLSTVAGNLFELQDVSGLRILDISLPDAFAAAYPGPAFGVAGTRRLASVPQGPIIGTIIKPSVGLDVSRPPSRCACWSTAASTSSRTMNCRATAPAARSISASPLSCG